MPIANETVTDKIFPFMVVTKELDDYDLVHPCATLGEAQQEFFMKKNAHSLYAFNNSAKKWNRVAQKAAENPYSFGTPEYKEWQRTFGATAAEM